MADYILTMTFSNEEKPFLLDVTNLLYDFELAHDFGVLVTESDYGDYKFNRFFWFRRGRHIKSEHRIRAARITKQSPLLLEVVITSLGALWILLQIIDKVSTWDISREKLKLEVEKLRIEMEEHRDKMRDIHVEQLRQHLDDQNAVAIEHSLSKRLSESPIKLVQLEIRKINASNDPDFKDDGNP